MILTAIVMMMIPNESYVFIIVILATWFVIRGAGMIWYYFTMARFMVGGRETLFMGVIWLDFGILTGSLTSVPHYFVILYLVAMHGFSGVVRILRTLEAKRNGASNWKLKLVHGIIDLLLAITCIIFLKQPSVAVLVYCIGLTYSALMRIITACRPTKFVFIK